MNQVLPLVGHLWHRKCPKSCLDPIQIKPFMGVVERGCYGYQSVVGVISNVNFSASHVALSRHLLSFLVIIAVNSITHTQLIWVPASECGASHQSWLVYQEKMRQVSDMICWDWHQCIKFHSVLWHRWQSNQVRHLDRTNVIQLSTNSTQE